MKNLLAFFISLVFVGGVSLGTEITKKYDFKDFTGVSVSHGMNVTISQSDSYSVEVSAEEDDLEKLKVEQDGESLNFTVLKDRYRFKEAVRINIKMPLLTAVQLSGGSDGNITMNISESFSASLSGGSNLEGELNCGDILLALSGGSEVTLNGKAADAGIAGSGSSSFKLKEFSVRNINSQLSGGSDVEISMNGTLNTVQSGGSNLTYYGEADLEDTLFSGGSGVEKGE